MSTAATETTVPTVGDDIRNWEHALSLPIGTTIKSNAGTTLQQGEYMFVKGEDGLQSVGRMAESAETGGVMRVISLPSYDYRVQSFSWRTYTMSPAEEAAVKVMKRRVATIGAALKESEEYCGVYERVMRSLDIDPDEHDREPAMRSVTVTVEITGYRTMQVGEEEMRRIWTGLNMEIDLDVNDFDVSFRFAPTWTFEVPEGSCACHLIERDMVVEALTSRGMDLDSLRSWSFDRECENC